MEIDAVSVFGVVLDSRPGAAPERVIGRVEIAARTRTQWNVIAHHPGLGVLRRQNVVIKRALIIIGIFGFRVPAKQMARQLQHIVGVAGLCRIWTQRL